MGKVETTTEAMEHIASVVEEVVSDISTETKKLKKAIDTIQEKTNREIKDSNLQILQYQSQIQGLEAQINAYRSMEDDDSSYQAEIASCQQQINALGQRLQKERMRNNEIRQTLLKFRQQSSLTLKLITQTNTAADNASTSGKQFIAKKTNIISSGYGKNVTGALAIGASLGMLFHGEDGTTQNSGGDNSAQSGFAVKSFGNDKRAAQIWGEEAFGHWKDSLNIVEMQAFVDYKKELHPHESSYYVNINNTLRGNDSFTDGNQMRYIRMHNALQRSSVPSDVIAYRAISQEALDSMMGNAQIAGSDGLRDNGFMSCSLAGENVFTDDRDIIMQLTIPEGTRGAYIGNIGNEYENECELLIDCGSSIFVTNTYEAPRNSITGYPQDTDMITIVEGVVDN